MNLIDFLSSPWAILPDRLLELQAIYATHLRGDKIDLEAIEARLGRPLANEQQEYRMEQGGIAVLPISGVIANKANMFTRISGGASAQLLQQQIASMRADSRVRGAVLDLDTPGGSVFGIPALAAEIRALAAEKPVASVSTGMMASAGYWLGSAANAIYLSGETDFMGSIGVVATHNYNPRKPGEVVTEITAGRYKSIATDNAPLSKEGRAYLQGQVDELYRAFVQTVADHRQVTADDVLEHMADGRVFVGRQALDAGLADGIMSLDDLVEQMATAPAKFSARTRAVFALGGLESVSAGAADAPPADEPVPPVEIATPEKDRPAMTHEELAAQFAAEHPEACALIRAEGAAAELARIQAVEGVTLPGHEALIASLKYDGKTSGPEAAVAVLAAEKAKLASMSAQLADAAPQMLPAAASAQGDGAESQPAVYRTPRGYTVDDKRAQLHARATEYAQAHACDYLTAVKAVSKEQ